MQVDVAMVAILVTVFLAIIAVAFGYGVLTQKVKSNRIDINNVHEEFQTYRKENKQEHHEINSKLDTIIRNGHK